MNVESNNNIDDANKNNSGNIEFWLLVRDHSDYEEQLLLGLFSTEALAALAKEEYIQTVTEINGVQDWHIRNLEVTDLQDQIFISQHSVTVMNDNVGNWSYKQVYLILGRCEAMGEVAQHLEYVVPTIAELVCSGREYYQSQKDETGQDQAGYTDETMYDTLIVDELRYENHCRLFPTDPINQTVETLQREWISDYCLHSLRWIVKGKLSQIKFAAKECQQAAALKRRFPNVVCPSKESSSEDDAFLYRLVLSDKDTMYNDKYENDDSDEDDKELTKEGDEQKEYARRARYISTIPQNLQHAHRLLAPYLYFLLQLLESMDTESTEKKQPEECHAVAAQLLIDRKDLKDLNHVEIECKSESTLPTTTEMLNAVVQVAQSRFLAEWLNHRAELHQHTVLPSTLIDLVLHYTCFPLTNSSAWKMLSYLL